MEDERIIGLFNARSEEALTALRAKYGQRAMGMAMNILGDPRDAEECINDAMHTLWQRIPPEHPEHLWAFLSRIIRNLCCSRLDYRNAARRHPGREVCLSELEGCLSTCEHPEAIMESRQIQEIINAFLDTLSPVNRIIFVRRYYYFDSCDQIGKRVGLRRGAVNTRLYRLREDLRSMLEQEEIPV